MRSRGYDYVLASAARVTSRQFRATSTTARNVTLGPIATIISKSQRRAQRSALGESASRRNHWRA